MSASRISLVCVLNGESGQLVSAPFRSSARRLETPLAKQIQRGGDKPAARFFALDTWHP